VAKLKDEDVEMLSASFFPFVLKNLKPKLTDSS